MIKLYQIIYTLFILPVMLLHKKTSVNRLQRLGKYDFKNDEKTIWIHCVSVGEILALAEFIKKIKAPPVVLSTSTPQGFELANSKLSDVCKQIVYFPYDTPSAVRKAIEAINPSLVYIMETEIWATFIDELKKAKIPTTIINARISERTFNSYKALSFFFAPILRKLTSVLAQSEADAKRFVEIGADPSSVRVMGNIKFDLKQPDIAELELGLSEDRLFVAGSTHSGEDKIVIEAYLIAKRNCPNLKLLIAPRHIERVGEIRALLKEYGLKYTVRSYGKNFSSADVLILDTTGELASVFAYADVAFIGGSLNNTGGHNPLEASIWGKPVLSGPNVKNFRHIYRVLSDFGCVGIVENAQMLSAELEMLLTNRGYYQKMTTRTKEVFEQNRGATEFLLDLTNKWREYENKI